MPTYDYRCERTGEMFELWQSFSDDALTECPQTHDKKSGVCGASVKKVFSKVGISFKGDGFYKNDHGSSSKKPAADTPSSDSSSKESSSKESPTKESPAKESSKGESSTTSGPSKTTSSD